MFNTPTVAGLGLAVAVLGCATAGLLTGHLAAGDFMTAVGIVTGGGAAVAGVHVAATMANNAPSPPAAPPVPAAAPPAGPGGSLP